MSEVLLSLVVPMELTEAVEDFLLARPHLAPGFTTLPAEGHGAGVELRRPAELVGGHAPRVQIQMLGDESALRQLLTELRQAMPRAPIFYWLVPVIAGGHLS